MNVYDCFCLKPGRDNFKIEPEHDDAYFFGPDEWKQNIHKSLQRALVLNEPLRIVWWGDYGIGKTHRVKYAIRHIRDNGLPFHPVFAVSSDIQDKSGFDKLHFPMVNNLGSGTMHELVEQFVLKMRQGAAQFGDWAEVADCEDVINAVRNFGNDNPDNWHAAWKWLTGLKLSSAESRLAGVTKPQVDSSVEYAEVLRAISLIIRHETDKRLVYFIDQVERLSKITNANAQNTWVETLRAVLDRSEIGMVLAVGASRLDQLPAVVLSPEIASRFGKEAYEKHHIKAFSQDECALFLQQLFDEWIDASKRDGVAVEKGWTNPDYAPSFYPLTAPAFTVFCKNVTQDPRDSKPRAFLHKLNNIAAEACMEDRRVIDKPFLLTQGYSD